MSEMRAKRCFPAACADVRALAAPALGHRLVLGYEAVADDVGPGSLVADILEAVPEPTAGIRGAP